MPKEALLQGTPTGCGRYAATEDAQSGPKHSRTLLAKSFGTCQVALRGPPLEVKGWVHDPMALRDVMMAMASFGGTDLGGSQALLRFSADLFEHCSRRGYTVDSLNAVAKGIRSLGRVSFVNRANCANHASVFLRHNARTMSGVAR